MENLFWSLIIGILCILAAYWYAVETTEIDSDAPPLTWKDGLGVAVIVLICVIQW